MARDGDDVLPLPSEGTYGIFEDPGGCHGKVNKPACDAQLIKDVETALGAHQIKDDELPSHIVQNWHYACTRSSDAQLNRDLCYFFYYWLGTEIIAKKPEAEDFANAMKAAYKNLDQSKCNNSCTNIYPDIIDTYFGWAKNLFDYEYNIKALKDAANCRNTLAGDKYTKLKNDSEKAYKELCDRCNENGDKYCNKFKNERMSNGVCKNRNLPELTCNSANQVQIQAEAQSEDEAGVSSEDDDDTDEDDINLLDLDKLSEEEEDEDGLPEGTLRVKKLKELPSNTEYYEMFKQDSIHCTEPDGWPKQMKVKLNEDTETANFAEQIVGALCYVESKKRNPGPNNEYCNFFYFWLGKVLSTKFKKGSEFNKIMKKIKDIMAEWVSDHGCTFSCTNKKHHKFFKERKLLFEYLKDKTKIKEQINNGTVKCTQNYFTYLQKISNTYLTMKAQYNGKQGNQICKEFREIFDQEVGGKLSEVLNLTCAVVTTTKNAVSADSTSGVGGTTPGNNKITPIVSSILGIAALPITTFFLYKYDLLPSAIKNTIFGGGRNNNNNNRRRRRERSVSRNVFDILTEDDTSTLYSTETGSTAEKASTTTDSTDGASTMYNEMEEREQEEILHQVITGRM
ncbi:KIR protein [Plasmodium coatneyi]|uniref:KIR protein n=1 Tax=Plasmodium coatneyi TaxID=208452 RepID=A0A1B1E6B2_9APIC|nr:KIR protein [Plasmodium coatneyi]ANQ10556.1 KIR protein [Plasmodium coatneyi]